MPVDPVRAQLAKLLDWEEAHVGFDAAVKDVPPSKRGMVPAGFAWSLWQLVEHIRRTQADILDFCRNPRYVEPPSMNAYWPDSTEPPSTASWDKCLRAVRRDRDALKELAIDVTTNLVTPIPHGAGQTYLRELILVADHTAYHVGQIVAVRRALGIWTTQC